MFCNQCGHELPQNARFCDQCGCPIATNHSEDIDTLAQAEKAYLSYDMKTALKLFSQLAEQGCSRAYYFLGQIYFWGYNRVVEADKNIAHEIFLKGASHHDPLCKLKLYEYADSKDEKEKIVQIAYDNVYELAIQGDIYAIFELGKIYDVIWHNPQKATEWYSKASDAGLWVATYNLALIYHEKGNDSVALYLYDKAIRIGYEQAMFSLGCLTLTEAINYDKKHAVQLIKEAERKGCHDAEDFIKAYNALMESHGLPSEFNNDYDIKDDEYDEYDGYDGFDECDDESSPSIMSRVMDGAAAYKRDFERRYNRELQKVQRKQKRHL